MTEWSVVGVIVALVGLFFAIYTPISKNTKENTKAMTELTVTMRIIGDQLSKFDEDNSKSHKRIWEHNDHQDHILNDHETRLQIIEKDSERGET